MSRFNWILSAAAALFVVGLALIIIDATRSDAVDPVATTAPAATDTRPTAAPEDSPVQVETDRDYEIGYSTSRCEFDRPPGVEVECGWLIVPENRNDPGNGREVRLHVAVFESTSDQPPADPIIYLEGGPGGDALETVPYAFSSNFEPFLDQRRFIMFDQRGTGFSEPSLNCSESTELAFDLLDQDLPTEEVAAMELAALRKCRDRLIDEGVDLTRYNSAESAADVADLRVALGFETWNLYGISYGTRLALTVMRDHPEGIRSVILDSSYPPDVDLTSDLAPNAARAFDVFFAGCAADASCAELYPNLEFRFFSLVDALEDDPIAISILEPFSGQRYDGVVDGDTLLGVLFQSLYSVEIFPSMPELIADLESGNSQSLSLVLSNMLANLEFVSVGQSLAVQCHEEISFSDLDTVNDKLAEYPELRGLVEGSTNLGPLAFEVCQLWQAGLAGSVENQPVKSAIPTLVLAGEYDPITPPAWGLSVANALDNSMFFEFPGIGHGASVSDDCPRSIAIDFLEDPTVLPDATCIERMGTPVFVPPVPGVVQLVPTELQALGANVETLAPTWEEVFPGTFARGSTGLDQTTLLMQAAPNLGEERILSLLSSQLGLETAPDSAGTYTSDLGRWNLYKLDINPQVGDLAIIDLEETTMFVLLVSDTNERDVLVESVLLPVLDATVIR